MQIKNFFGRWESDFKFLNIRGIVYINKMHLLPHKRENIANEVFFNASSKG